MENKINIAELLRDCPQGMELDCSVFEDVTLYQIDTDIENDFPIRIKTKNDYFLDLTKYGTYSNVEEAKCLIFPKGKTTWEGFQRPFKNGDILAIGDTIYIYNGIEELSPYPSHYVYVIADKNGLFAINTSTKKYGTRFATEEEKEKLFKAIENNGYKWNPETKTLEKLPKFNVGKEQILHRIREELDKVYKKYENEPFVDDITEGFEDIIHEYYEITKPY